MSLDDDKDVADRIRTAIERVTPTYDALHCDLIGLTALELLALAARCIHAYDIALSDADIVMPREKTLSGLQRVLEAMDKIEIQKASRAN